MRNKQARLTASCALIFASFPLLYLCGHGGRPVGGAGAWPWGLLGVGVALALDDVGATTAK